MVITTKEMIILEDEAESKGTSKLILMERAGQGIAKEIEKRFDKTKKMLFVCYHGNNGGDGLTAARYLYEAGYGVKINFIGDESKFKDEAKANYEMLLSINPEVFVKEVLYSDYDVLVDAMLGIGVSGEIKEPILGAIKSMNSAEGYKVAIDVPTGVDPDTGKEADVFFNEDLTITMHDLKPGLDTAKTVVVNIGL